MGITQGIYVDGSSITNAADFRAYDSNVDDGFQLHMGGSADSYIEGDLGLGINAPLDKLHVVGKHPHGRWK